MKYFYLLLATAFIIGEFLCIAKGENLIAAIFVLATVLCLGIDDILDELRKSNQEVITRDPKTGRFKKK